MPSDHGLTPTKNTAGEASVPNGAAGEAPEEIEDELGERRRANDRVIGAAVGITMTRYGITYPDAMTFVEDLARFHRRGLLDLARTITSSRWPAAGSFDWARDGSPVGRLEQTTEESAAGRLLDLLVETSDLNDLLKAVAGLAVESVPGCDSASITVIRDGAPATVASFDARAVEVDDLQYGGGDGPCLRAARTDEVVQVHDLSAPVQDVWKMAAIRVGFHSVLALPIASETDVAAALNLYSTSPGPWPAAAQPVGEDLALYTGDAITLAYRHGTPRPGVIRPVDSHR